MKEFEENKRDKPEIHAVKPITKEKSVKKLIRRPGHRIFQLELATSIISEVTPEKQNAKIVPEVDLRTGRVTGVTSQEVGEIKRKEGFLYCTALNSANAEKVFFRMRGKKYIKKKK